jgi:hypothetical protein
VHGELADLLLEIGLTAAAAVITAVTFARTVSRARGSLVQGFF